MSESLIIAENERRFMAQELHDHIAQTLLQMNLQIAICKRYLELNYEQEAISELDNLEKQIGAASGQVRQLIADLRPPVSDDGLFDSMLQNIIAVHQKRGGPPVKLNKPESVNLGGNTKLAVARIIQEALQNIRKHAQAGKVEINFQPQANGTLTITITDDGIGFDDALVPNPLAEKGGAGFVNMEIRASAIGATLNISAIPNQGTTIQLTDIPL